MTLEKNCKNRHCTRSHHNMTQYHIGVTPNPIKLPASSAHRKNISEHPNTCNTSQRSFEISSSFVRHFILLTWYRVWYVECEQSGSVASGSIFMYRQSHVRSRHRLDSLQHQRDCGILYSQANHKQWCSSWKTGAYLSFSFLFGGSEIIEISGFLPVGGRIFSAFAKIIWLVRKFSEYALYWPSPTLRNTTYDGHCNYLLIN